MCNTTTTGSTSSSSSSSSMSSSTNDAQATVHDNSNSNSMSSMSSAAALAASLVEALPFDYKFVWKAPSTTTPGALEEEKRPNEPRSSKEEGNIHKDNKDEDKSTEEWLYFSSSSKRETGASFSELTPESQAQLAERCQTFWNQQQQQQQQDRDALSTTRAVLKITTARTVPPPSGDDDTENTTTTIMMEEEWSLTLFAVPAVNPPPPQQQEETKWNDDDDRPICLGIGGLAQVLSSTPVNSQQQQEKEAETPADSEHSAYARNLLHPGAAVLSEEKDSSNNSFDVNNSTAFWLNSNGTVERQFSPWDYYMENDNANEHDNGSEHGGEEKNDSSSHPSHYHENLWNILARLRQQGDEPPQNDNSSRRRHHLVLVETLAKLRQVVEETVAVTTPTAVTPFSSSPTTTSTLSFQIHDSGQNQHWEYHVRPLTKQQQQQPLLFWVSAQNITQQTLATAALQEQNDFYQEMIQFSPNAYCLCEVVTDANDKVVDHRYLETNQNFLEMTGLTEQQVIGQCWRDLFPGIDKDPSDWIGRTARVAQEGTVDEFSRYSVVQKRWWQGVTYAVKNQSNHQRDINDTNNPTTTTSSKRTVTVFTEITEQKNVEERIRESEERHRHLFETMKQGVTYLNADGNYSDSNQAALDFLGLTVDQFQGRTGMDPRWNTIHEDGSDWPANDHPINHVFQTGVPALGFVMGVFNPTQERYRWLSVDCMPRFREEDRGDKPYQVCSVFTDITEIKETEKALTMAKEKAEEADKLKSAFLATMSHEIRTPLNGIMGHLDLIISTNLTEAYKDENMDSLRVAMQSSKLLVSIIEDILDLSKIEAGQLDIAHKPFSIMETIQQSIELARAYRIQRKKEHVEILQHIDTLPADVIYGDQFRLQQILNNLLSNAIKFTAEGKVTLSMKLEEEKLVFCVQDTGKGIPQNKIDTIFEPFRQVELSDTREHGGTGLGLTICCRLLELMGGSIKVESSIGKDDHGSCFFLTLPFEEAAGHSIQPEIPRPNSGTSLVKMAEGASGKILVAEDDHISRRVVLRMLEKAGQQTLVAKDGLEAVEIFREKRDEIALILMDVQMPRLDGLEASRRIRSLESEAPDGVVVPIIALSAGAMKGDKEKGIEYGMSDYMTKPISNKALMATLVTFLGEGSIKRTSLNKSPSV